MTAPLVVGTDRERVIRLRRLERRTALALAINSLVFGVLIAGLAGGFFLYLALNAPSNTLFYTAASFALGLMGLFYLFQSIRRFRAVSARSDYWAAADLSDVAFRLDAVGITVRIPSDIRENLVPWSAVRGLTMGGLDLVFQVDPGLLPARYNDQIDFGLLALDTQPETIRAAAVEFSGGRVGA